MAGTSDGERQRLLGGPGDVSRALTLLLAGLFVARGMRPGQRFAAVGLVRGRRCPRARRHHHRRAPDRPRVQSRRAAGRTALGTASKTTGCRVRGSLPDPACTPRSGSRVGRAGADLRVRVHRPVRNVSETLKASVYAAYGIASHEPVARARARLRTQGRARERVPRRRVQRHPGARRSAAPHGKELAAVFAQCGHALDSDSTQAPRVVFDGPLRARHVLPVLLARSGPVLLRGSPGHRCEPGPRWRRAGLREPALTGSTAVSEPTAAVERSDSA